LTFFPNCGILALSTHNPIGDKLPTFRVQREYTNWEEITVEADSEEDALELAQEEEAWEYAIDASTYNYTGEYWVGDEEANWGDIGL
jgi:hypothetical protein